MEFWWLYYDTTSAHTNAITHTHTQTHTYTPHKGKKRDVFVRV